MSKHILFTAGKLTGRYDGAIHGERKLQIIDPEFEWPMIEVPNPEFYPEASGEDETTLIQDPSVTPPTILVDNPDCIIPADAIEVSEELFFRTINETDGVWTLNADGSITKEPLPPAPPYVPQSVTMRQARLALLGAGLLTQVNDAVAAMEGLQGEAARIEWEYATSVERNSPLVDGLAVALNLNAAALDNLFTVAAGI